MRCLSIILIIILWGCAHEDGGVSPDIHSTFVRTYYEYPGFIPKGYALLNTGGLLLAVETNTRKSPSDHLDLITRFVRLDKDGTFQYQLNYPPEDSLFNGLFAYHFGVSPSAMISVGGDDAITIGTRITSDSLYSIELMVSQGDQVDGFKLDPKRFGLPNSATIKGVDIALAQNGNHIILGYYEGNGLIIAELDKLNYSLLWYQVYFDPALLVTSSRSLVVDANNRIIISGKTANDSSTIVLSFEMNKSFPVNSVTLEAFRSESIKEANSGFALTGSKQGILTRDVALILLGSDLNVTSSFVYPMPYSHSAGIDFVEFTPDNFVLLSHVNASSVNGYGDSDLLISKVTQSGELIWSKVYGTIWADEALALSQALDGGLYAIGSYVQGFGTYTTVYKLDKDGNLYLK